MSRLFHVTSTRNRKSIREHGLDWTRMGAAPGIAGSARPEQEGVFLAAEDIAEFFLAMASERVDVWAVDGVDAAELITTGDGFDYLPGRIGPDRLMLVRESVAPVERHATPSSGAYASTLTITWDESPPSDSGDR